jgi:UPF0271 protein
VRTRDFRGLEYYLGSCGTNSAMRAIVLVVVCRIWEDPPEDGRKAGVDGGLGSLRYGRIVFLNSSPLVCLGDCLRLQIDLNCDLGEGYGAFKVGRDAEIMPYITSASIACGFHAGDPMTMAQTVLMAKKHNVAIGAHPGYPDLLGFGRRRMQLTSEEVKNYTVYQVGALQGFAKTTGTHLQHVKPHGALYNMAAKDKETSEGIVDAVKALDDRLIILAPPKSVLAKVAAEAELRVAREFFADRAYNADGSLVSREQPDAIVEEPRKVVERAVNAVVREVVLASTGEVVNLGEVHTICVHGDTPTAVRLVKTLKDELIKADIEVRPVGSFI